MTVMTDEEWAALKGALDAVRSRRRRPMKDERQTVEAVVPPHPVYGQGRTRRHLRVAARSSNCHRLVG